MFYRNQCRDFRYFSKTMTHDKNLRSPKMNIDEQYLIDSIKFDEEPLIQNFESMNQ